METVIVDASLLLSLILPDESTKPESESFRHKFQSNQLLAIAPPLLKYEVVNVLRSAIVRQRCTAIVSQALLSEFQKLPISYQETNFANTLSLAIKHNLSVYDASYLDLALRLHHPLYSLDHHLSQLASGQIQPNL